MCLQSVLCPPHPHPAPTHTATLPDFVLAPGVHRQPKGGFVKSQGEREAGSSGGGASMPSPPSLHELMSHSHWQGWGGEVPRGRAEEAWLSAPGDVLGWD